MNEYDDWYINLLTYPKNLALDTLSTTELHTFLQKAEPLTFPNKIYILNYVKDTLNNRLQEITMKNWIKNRLDERTSWDGAMLVAVGVIVLIAGPFAKLAAYAAIAYGAWTIWKSE